MCLLVHSIAKYTTLVLLTNAQANDIIKKLKNINYLFLIIFCIAYLKDRVGKFCSAFQKVLEAGGVRSIAIPPRNPNLDAYT